jgi:beta-glucosidase
MISDFQKACLSTRLGIPMIYGIDAVHGHNNVYGATIFPHNVGLGATRQAPFSSSRRQCQLV